jgi:hypothetical protein
MVELVFGTPRAFTLRRWNQPNVWKKGESDEDQEQGQGRQRGPARSQEEPMRRDPSLGQTTHNITGMEVRR